jgi:hypothetical protein
MRVASSESCSGISRGGRRDVGREVLTHAAPSEWDGWDAFGVASSEIGVGWVWNVGRGLTLDQRRPPPMGNVVFDGAIPREIYHKAELIITYE